MRKHERTLAYLAPVALGFILSALIGLQVGLDTSLSYGLTVGACVFLLGLIVSLIVGVLASDNSEARTANRWKRYYISRVSEASRNSEALSAEIDSLTNLVSDFMIDASEWYDSEKRDLLRLNLLAWIAKGGTIGTYAEAFHNGEGVGDDDCLTREHSVRRYLGQRTH
jgi:uncharacterized membrane protein